MSVLITLLGAWLAFNAALFAALWFRRPNPKLRAEHSTGLSAPRRSGSCAERRRRHLVLISGK
jgi:hypothetical protein